MYDKFVVLPDAKEIVDRLATVNDDPHMKIHFYPLFAEEAGRELSPEGINIMFALKIHEFMKKGYLPIMRDLLYATVPKFIDALVDDEEVAEAAKEILREGMQKIKREGQI